MSDKSKPAPRKHSREWFAAKRDEVSARIETYPAHIKAGMVWASATVPPLPATHPKEQP
jgi:hypothetical protein